MPALRQLVYCSSTPTLLGPDDLLAILQVSRQNNAAAGVTGALLYHDGNVMQVLEGPPEAGETTFRRVEGDARHRQVTTMLDRRAEARDFAGWAMGFVDARDLPEAERAAAGSLRAVAASGAGRAQRLLGVFQSLQRTAGA